MRRRTGYRNPPVKHRFKRGVSGNPRGRPKGSLSLQAELQKVLQTTIPMASANGKRKSINALRAILTKLVNKALQHGDVKAANAIVQLLIKMFPGTKEPPGPAGLSASDEEILQHYRERILAEARLSEVVR